MEFPASSQTIDHQSLLLLAAMTFGIWIIAMKGCQMTSIKGEVVVSASLSPLILSFIYHHSPMREMSEPYHILISDQQPTECCKRFVFFC